MSDRNTYDRGPFEHEMMAKAEAAAQLGPIPVERPGRLMMSCERLADYQSRITAVTDLVGLVADRTLGAQPQEARTANIPQLHNDPAALDILQHWLDRMELAIDILSSEVRRLEAL